MSRALLGPDNAADVALYGYGIHVPVRLADGRVVLAARAWQGRGPRRALQLTCWPMTRSVRPWCSCLQRMLLPRHSARWLTAFACKRTRLTRPASIGICSAPHSESCEWLENRRDPVASIEVLILLAAEVGKRCTRQDGSMKEIRGVFE